jgi:hypothetical protein
MNRFGWVSLVAMEAVFGVASDEMLTIADNDRKGRFEILAIRIQRRQGQGVAKYWFPWAVRAASGHSLTWLDYGTIMVPLDEQLCSQLPAMVHGTQHVHLNSILLYGLVPDREFNMFNMIPHFDPRAAQGQRFDTWNSLVYFSPLRLIQGEPFIEERSPDGNVVQRATMQVCIASSGSLNVRGRVPSGYIEKVVIDCSKISGLAKKGQCHISW